MYFFLEDMNIVDVNLEGLEVKSTKDFLQHFNKLMCCD